MFQEGKATSERYKTMLENKTKFRPNHIRYDAHLGQIELCDIWNKVGRLLNRSD